MADRKDQRRADRAIERAHRRGELEVGVDPELVLRAPLHWHVDVVIFSHMNGDGVPIDPSHVHNLVTNDVTFAVSYARRMAPHFNGADRRGWRVEQVTYCGTTKDEAKHWDGAIDALTRPAAELAAAS